MEQRTRDFAILMVGETLLVLQKFEQCLVAALLSMVSESEADGKLQQVLLRDKETLGRLFKYFSERTELPEHFAEAFDSLLAMRNLFVHKLFMEPWFDIKTPEGCARLQAFMKDIRAKAKVALHVMIASSLERPAIVLMPEAEERSEHILDRIQSTVEPHFGELSEDAYVDKVVANAMAMYQSTSRDT